MSYNKETNLYEGYIYCITNKKNGKQYIGQTLRDVRTRFNCHLSESKNKYDTYPLHRAMRKYGKNGFDVDTQKTIYCISKKELQKQLNYYEKFYIKEFNTYNPDGYNLTIGGATSGYCRGKEVIKVDRFGSVINEYISQAEACRQEGLNPSCLGAVLSKRTKKAYGYYWYYKKNIQVKDGKVLDWKINDKFVAQYSIFGDLLNIYDSLNDASKATGIPSPKIGQCCLCKIPIANGFQFMYFKKKQDVLCKIEKYDSVQCQNKIVAQYSCFGDLLSVFKNRKIAESKLGIRWINIDKVCRNKTGTTSDNYQFRYYDNYDCVKEKIEPSLKYPQWGKIIAQYDFDGCLIHVFNSVIGASEKLGISKVSIEDCCTGKKPSAVGFQFMFYDSVDDVLENVQKIKHKKRPVWQETMFGEKITCFSSATDAEREVHVDHSRIAACCRSKIESAGGYKWKYAEDGAA